MDSRPLVVVGAGPRALAALVALDDALARMDGGPVAIDVFDPFGPGGGVWDPTLADHLVLNVDAHVVDVSGVAVPYSYPAWARAEGLPDRTYPPRSWVGRYLRWAWESLAASPRLEISFHREQVLEVAPVAETDRSEPGQRWRVSTADGTVQATSVLVATGHRGGAGVDHQWVSQHLAAGAADGVVRIRGAALTAYDVVLDLTAGRGGRWEPDPAAASGLRYLPSGTEPRGIELVSRSGLLLTPKPETEQPELRQAAAQAAAPLGERGHPDEVWWQTLWSAAVAAAEVSGVRLPAQPPLEVLDAASPAPDPWEQWRADLRRAAGEVDDDPAWWWGRAWSAAYPTLAAGLERVPREQGCWEQWRRRATRLERWAFGPPSETVRRLLALAEAGLLRIRAESSEQPPIDLIAAVEGPGVVCTPQPWEATSDPTAATAAPDPLWSALIEGGQVWIRPGERGVFTDPEGQCVAPNGAVTAGLFVLGRPTEDPVIGHDTLNRTVHRDTERWARAVAETMVADSRPDSRPDLRARCAGVAPLTGRLEPWMVDLVDDPEQCAALIAEHGSALNLLDFSPVARHGAELIEAAAECGVEARVFVARKANKALGLVAAAQAAGLGLDVASYGELEQVLAAGVPSTQVIVSAAVKSAALIDLAVEADVAVSVDNLDELHRIACSASARGRHARVALRLAVVAEGIAPTRFGITLDGWRSVLADPAATAQLRIEGVHFHLHGYRAEDRAEGLRQACDLVDLARAAGHPVRYVDIGGGLPVTYLRSETQWHEFWSAVAAQQGDQITWRGDRLGLLDPMAERPSPAVYPFWQQADRGAWLRTVLHDPGPGSEPTVAGALRERGLALHLEPGRAILEGCGVTLAEVVFRKTTSDGVPIVGLQMNRTQVRSTSADFLVDPLWIRPPGAGEPSPPGSGFLVGAYCIEDEMLSRRRLTFPHGVAVGDIAVFPNTAGYLMHIVESASHQIPLARNLVRTASGDWEVDGIDVVR